MRYALGLLASAAAVTTPALADEVEDPTFWYGVEYVAEVAGPVSGGVSNRGVFLDNLSVEAGLDLEQAIGWQGASLNLHLLNNTGGEPNDYVGALEGVSNIAVGRHRAKIFELWLEQAFAGGAGAAVLGFYDLNRDFYVTDAAGLLTAPPFGIGSEVAATGPNGPSIFPSSAFGVHVRYAGAGDWYAQGAVVDATAGVLGDPDGMTADFENGALVIAEAGLTRGGKTGFGGWVYSEDQDDIRALTLAGDPEQTTAFGVYAVAERRLSERHGVLDGFVRVGVSDGDTTDFQGGVQAGVLWGGLVPARPDAQASFGVRYAAVSDKAQDNFRDAGGDPASGEWGMELTYADALTPWLTLQPDLQVVWDAGADATADPVVILGARMILGFSGGR